MFSVESKPFAVEPLGGTQLSNLSYLRVGAAGEIMNIDREGNAAFGGDISAASGTFTGTIYVGSANVLLDGANKRIVINDGTNDRVLIGYLSSGF